LHYQESRDDETNDKLDAATIAKQKPQTAESSSASKIVPIPNLQSHQFRHPLDQRLTSLAQKAPLFQLAEDALRRGFPLIEQGVRLDLLSSSVRVSPKQLPELHTLLVEACEVLNFPVIPDLYVQSNPQANAYTLALTTTETTTRSSNNNKQTGTAANSPPIVVVTSALVDRCTPQELQAILGHELGHILCEHALYLTLGNLASSVLPRLPGMNIEQVLTQEWRLAAEYSCDRASLLVAQDSKIVASALLKLFAGTARYELDVSAFVEQSLEYEKELQTANRWVQNSFLRKERTHPLPVQRVAELERWYRSKDYQNLVRSNPEQ